jgi:capsular polysaccharide biosynthesis protein
LANEDQVMGAVTRAGFEVVTLTGMTVAEQARLFNEASHIIAPHGAGLTNILFCQPGTVLLELHMDGYTQWAFRRLAGILNMNYGCLVGTAVEPWNEWPHLNSWTLDVDELKAAMAAESFRRVLLNS